MQLFLVAINISHYFQGIKRGVVKEVPADLEQMQLAFSAKDWPLVEKKAHKIKGGAVYLGTIRMKIACQYVDRYWKTGKRDLIEPLYHQAVRVIEETLTYVDSWLIQ